VGLSLQFSPYLIQRMHGTALNFFFDVMAGLELHIIGPDVPSWGQATPDGGGDVRTAVSRRPEP
jgi:hypothetical protein